MNDLEKEKEAFVDHLKSQMSEKVSKTQYSQHFNDTNSWKEAQKKKNIILDKISEQKNNIMRFKLMEEYSMDESEE